MKQFIFCLLLVGLASTIFSAWICSLWDGQEDAYITFSYAKHIAQGKGFVASVGSKPSLGTTTPLFTLLLAVLAYIHIPPHIAGMWSGVFCHGLIAMLVVVLAKKFMSTWLALAAGIYWAVALAIFFRLGGMETPVQILLILLMALSEIHFQASKISAVLLALLLLCRPDSLLLLAVILAFWISNARTRPFILRNLFIMAVIILPWIIYALQTFGSIIPSSLISKFTIHMSGVVNLNSFMVDYFPFLMLLPVALLVCILGAIDLWPESYEFRPFLIWIPIYYFSFLVGQAPDFAWYYVPPLVFFPVIFNRGLINLTQLIPTAFKSTARWVCVILATGIWIYANLISTYGLRTSPHPERVHKTLALFLREYSNEQDLIAAGEVGMLSYYLDRRVVDLLGLTSPEVLKWSMKLDFASIIRHENPRFIMVGGYDPTRLGYHEIKRLPFVPGMDYLLYERDQSQSKAAFK
jgi:hypothetical protein